MITGGSSTMEGVVELAEEIFHMPVRLASPQAVAGMSEVVNNPIYATGVGLLIHGFRQMDLGGGPALRGEDALAARADEELVHWAFLSEPVKRRYLENTTFN